MASIYETALEQRRQLLAGERDAATRLAQTYASAYDAVEAALKRLLLEIGDTTPTKQQLISLTQYRDLLTTLANVNDDLARRTGAQVASQQRQAFLAGADAARVQVDTLISTAGLNQLAYLPAPTDALAALTGLAADGSPLPELLRQSGNTTAQNVIDALTRGIAAGLDPARIAEIVKNVWGQSLARALRLSRTETLRAYRTGTLWAYQQSDVVTAWEWLAARSARTCPACLALDGRIFQLTEPMPAHVNCRCTMIPVVLDERTSKRTSGADWFANQSEAQKMKILGQRGYDAYKNGATLDQFLVWRDSDLWGKQALWAVPN